MFNSWSLDNKISLSYLSFIFSIRAWLYCYGDMKDPYLIGAETGNEFLDSFKFTMISSLEGDFLWPSADAFQGGVCFKGTYLFGGLTLFFLFDFALLSSQNSRFNWFKCSIFFHFSTSSTTYSSFISSYGCSGVDGYGMWSGENSI